MVPTTDPTTPCGQTLDKKKEEIIAKVYHVIPTFKKGIIYERTPDLIFEDPSYEFCDMEIKLAQMDLSGLFTNRRFDGTVVNKSFPEFLKKFKKRLNSENWNENVDVRMNQGPSIPPRNANNY